MLMGKPMVIKNASEMKALCDPFILKQIVTEAYTSRNYLVSVTSKRSKFIAWHTQCNLPFRFLFWSFSEGLLSDKYQVLAN